MCEKYLDSCDAMQDNVVYVTDIILLLTLETYFLVLFLIYTLSTQRFFQGA